MRSLNALDATKGSKFATFKNGVAAGVHPLQAMGDPLFGMPRIGRPQPPVEGPKITCDPQFNSETRGML